MLYINVDLMKCQTLTKALLWGRFYDDFTADDIMLSLFSINIMQIWSGDRRFFCFFCALRHEKPATD